MYICKEAKENIAYETGSETIRDEQDMLRKECMAKGHIKQKWGNSKWWVSGFGGKNKETHENQDCKK